MTNLKFNKADYRLIGIYLLIAVAWLTYRYTVEGYTHFEIWTGLLGFVLKTIALIYLIVWSVQRFLVVQKNYFFFYVFVFFALFLIGYVDLLRDYYTSDPPWEWTLSFSQMVIESFYHSTPDGALPVGLLLGKKYYENRLEYTQLQNAQKEMELKALRSQYDPHFLYNSLNTIDALIDYSPKEKVKEYVSHLASLYRYFIHSKDQDVASVQEELALAKNYCYLIKTRFGETYQFNFPEETITELTYLPNGALLTVLENVVKHNSADKGESILTKIQIENNSIQISNSKNKTKKVDEPLGTGLQNLDKRYQLLSHQHILITETNGAYTVQLPLLNQVP